jgi:hypothetical protein
MKLDKKSHTRKNIFSPKGIVSKIFFSMSSPSLEVISDAMNPGATAFTWKIILIRPGFHAKTWKVQNSNKKIKLLKTHINISACIFLCNSLCQANNTCLCSTIVGLPNIANQTNN